MKTVQLVGESLIIEESFALSVKRIFEKRLLREPIKMDWIKYLSNRARTLFKKNVRGLQGAEKCVLIRETGQKRNPGG